MTVHQVVDVRVGKGRWQFANEEAEQQHQQKMQEFCDALPKDVRFAVAPGNTVNGRGGRVFNAGEAISQDDVEADSGWPEQGRPAWKVFADKVFDGAVVENYGYVPRLEGDPNLLTTPPTAGRR